MTKNDLVDFTKELVWQKLFSDARTRIVPTFWSRFGSVKDKQNAEFQSFSEATKMLNSDISKLENHFSFLDRLSRNVCTKSFDLYKMHLSAILLSQIPTHFESSVNSFYTKSFKAFMVLEKRSYSYGKRYF